MTWFSSYVTGRTQRALFNSCQSKAISVTSGAPQRRHLGRLEFILFVKTIPKRIQHSNALIAVADDVKLFLSFDSLCAFKLFKSNLSNTYTMCVLKRIVLNSKHEIKIYSAATESFRRIIRVPKKGLNKGKELNFHILQ